MKKVFLFVATLLAFGALTARAQFTFTTNSGAITITGYNTAAGSTVVIPASTNGYPVTTIGANAFIHLTAITNVTIPNSVTTIGTFSFEYCSGLASVTIPSSVTTIGSQAFQYCSGLTNLSVDPANPNYASAGGVLFDKNLLNLIQFPGGWTGSYAVPGSVTNIGTYSFEYCNGLTSVAVPNSVTTIGSQAFSRCSSLTNISVDAANPNYASADGVLFDKNLLHLIQFPGGWTGSYTVPNGVTLLGTYSFQYCTGLTGVTIPNSVTFIGLYAFYNCSSLASVAIPNSVTGMGNDAFAFSGLISVTIPGSVTTSLGDEFANCSSLTSLTINNGVISGSEFINCSSLTSLTLPNNVTNIGTDAFANCPRLHRAYFPGNAPAANTTAFSGETGTVYYQPGATGWGATFGGWPTVSGLPPTPPAIAISTYGNQPAVFFPTATGTNFVLEMTTNLASGQWVIVSNGTPVNGIVITNAPANAFFQLR